MEQIKGSTAETPFPTLVVEHLREVDRRNKAVWAAPNLPAFDDAVEHIWRFDDAIVEAFARGARLVRLEGVKTPVTKKIVMVPALTGKGAEYVAEFGRPEPLKAVA